MSLYDTYATNSAAENDGVWVDFGPELKVKIRRFSAPAVKLVRTRLEKPYAGILRGGGSIPDDVLEGMTEQIIAEAVIVDWKGAKDRNGDEIPNTTEAKLQVLKDLPDFRNQVAAVAMERETFKRELDEDAVKN